MVKLDRIYTRGGDAGATSLGFGRRVAKSALRVHAMGEVDEANAMLGVCRGTVDDGYAEMLGRIQNDLFDLGADLASPPEFVPQGKPAVRISMKQVLRLEREIDAMNADLPPLHSFIVPSDLLHVARAIVRRAERTLVGLAEQEDVGQPALSYLNRLSDHVFVMARAVAEISSDSPPLWRPALHA